jgi:hypothetical protein
MDWLFAWQLLFKMSNWMQLQKSGKENQENQGIKSGN